MHKVKFSYLLVLLLSLAFAFLVGGSMPYFLLYIVILSFLIPIFHLLLSLIGLKSKLATDKTQIYAGESITLKYKIRNKNFFTIPVLETIINIDENLKNKNIIYKKLSLNPLEETIFKETLCFERRGFYENISFKIKISDIYSLFKLNKTINNNLNIIVYPNIIELDSFAIRTNKTFGNKIGRAHV